MGDAVAGFRANVNSRSCRPLPPWLSVRIATGDKPYRRSIAVFYNKAGLQCVYRSHRSLPRPYLQGCIGTHPGRYGQPEID